jgi:precorrin-4 methylase
LRKTNRDCMKYGAVKNTLDVVRLQSGEQFIYASR